MFQIQPPLRCIDFAPRHELNAVRPVLVARELAGNGGVEPAVLKIFPGGRVYLAALADQSDRVVEWLEVWVQCSADLETSPLARAAVISNASHDRQWSATLQAIRELDPEQFLETHWEKRAPVPLAIDLERMAVVPLVHSDSKRPLELCRDDAALSAAGLGAYSATLQRWFRSESRSGEIAWLSLADLLLSDGAEQLAVPPDEAGNPRSDFNLGAGVMLLRRHAPVTIEGLLGWLGGGQRAGTGDSDTFDSSPIEQPILATLPPLQRSEAIGGDAALANAVLRLQLWCSMTREVHRASSRVNLPFLNLTTESFRVSFQAAPALLQPAPPFRTVLVHPGEAVALEREAGFVPLRGVLGSPFASPKFGGWLEGSGTMRIRQMSEAGEGRLRLEGVIDGSELKDVPAGNRVWVQTPVDGRAVSFFASIEAEKSGARAGTTFTAPAAELPAPAASRLKLAARQPCQFVVLRPVSPAFDIHSLGVIGVRLLLAEDPQAVNELVDDLFELAAILPRDQGIADLRELAASNSVGDRLRRLFQPPSWARDSAGASALGETVWFAVIRELIEFVAVEIPEGPGAHDAWLVPLSDRLHSLETVTQQAARLLAAPRADHLEVARIVHGFV